MFKELNTFVPICRDQSLQSKQTTTQLGNLKDSHGRLAGWALSLQQYYFTIVHRSGSKNANADEFSRDQWSLTKVGGVSGIPTLTTECPKDKNNQTIDWIEPEDKSIDIFERS